MASSELATHGVARSATSAAMAKPRNSQRSRRDEYVKHVLIAPPLLFFAFFAIFPLVFVSYVSLSHWSLSGRHSFAGLANYGALFASPAFITSLKNSVLFAVATVVPEYLLGLGVALLVYNVARGQTVLRVLLLSPMMLTPVVVGFIWKMLYDPSYGPIDFFLRQLGLGSVPWLSSTGGGFGGIVLADVWEWTPFIFLILLAGLRSMPAEPFEAALVDGASSWRRFWDLTMPMLLPASVAAILLRTIEAFKLFDIVFFITGGGPGVSTSTVTLNAYFTGLQGGDLGSAAAQTIVLLLIVIVVTLLLLKLLAVFGRSGRRTPHVRSSSALQAPVNEMGLENRLPAPTPFLPKAGVVQ